MKLSKGLFLVWLGVLIGGLAGLIVRRTVFQQGFDSGRAAVLRQMHNCISSNDNQWVQDKKYIWVDPHPLFGPREVEKHYTNRFFTNWTLRVRQP